VLDNEIIDNKSLWYLFDSHDAAVSMIENAHKRFKIGQSDTLTKDDMLAQLGKREGHSVYDTMRDVLATIDLEAMEEMRLKVDSRARMIEVGTYEPALFCDDADFAAGADAALATAQSSVEEAEYDAFRHVHELSPKGVRTTENIWRFIFSLKEQEMNLRIGTLDPNTRDESTAALGQFRCKWGSNTYNKQRVFILSGGLIRIGQRQRQKRAKKDAAGEEGESTRTLGRRTYRRKISMPEAGNEPPPTSGKKKRRRNQEGKGNEPQKKVRQQYRQSSLEVAGDKHDSANVEDSASEGNAECIGGDDDKHERPGRGRPRIRPIGPKRPRGRPRKIIADPQHTGGDNAQPKRPGRGRPRLHPIGPKRPPGRPQKTLADPKHTSTVEDNTQQKCTGRGTGRTRLTASQQTGVIDDPPQNRQGRGWQKKELSAGGPTDQRQLHDEVDLRVSLGLHFVPDDEDVLTSADSLHIARRRHGQTSAAKALVASSPFLRRRMGQSFTQSIVDKVPKDRGIFVQEEENLSSKK
jgi:hypothetical protein